MALEVGSRIAHYDVTALIGEGGMGQVYQATDTKLKRQVALKVLHEVSADENVQDGLPAKEALWFVFFSCSRPWRLRLQ